MGQPQRERLGCRLHGGGRAEFLVWAPRAQRVEVRLVEPEERMIEMRRGERGYHHALAEGIEAGSLYFFRLNEGTDRADPASRWQPRGVHGPSMVVDGQCDWNDSAWKGLPLEEYLLYEIHVGTFTPEGTFAAICGRLDELKALGVTAVELMPVAQFPGTRNWGYDGVYPYAAQNSYGGPQGLQRLVDACHASGLAVVLDVVYNHLGPEGNYLSDFGPYFTDRYRTPWGEAINFDGPESDEVRRYFIENALDWITEFHFDALRLDAVHAIVDRSARPFLEELAERVHERAEELGRRVWLIAESDRNDSRLVRPRERGGLGLDALWNDDFHHAVHALITKEGSGYYADFGRVSDLAKAFTDHFVYSGEYSAYRRRRHGNPAQDVPARRFVVFAQNHDQTGNRMLGERLAALGSFEDAKLAAGTVLLSPFLPLLFMGEEYGEPAPFLYFVSHGDGELIEAVRRGRREEFAAFAWSGEPPDPQAESTFLRSKLSWRLRAQGRHSTLCEFYRELIRVRRRTPALSGRHAEDLRVIAHEEEKALVIWRKSGESEAMVVFAFADRTARLPLSSGDWLKELDSSEERWLGGGSQAPAKLEGKQRQELEMSPRSVVVYKNSESG
ncbi:MAG TPA: malto-oligosyltrehalose trehalohydrolase [Patescibacteria group bacterium]|nr:malto-oligosyltrehalose trehalohydrolase [Patescibacteria group bacterium]